MISTISGSVWVESTGGGSGPRGRDTYHTAITHAPSRLRLSTPFNQRFCREDHAPGGIPGRRVAINRGRTSDRRGNQIDAPVAVEGSPDKSAADAVRSAEGFVVRRDVAKFPLAIVDKQLVTLRIRSPVGIDLDIR